MSNEIHPAVEANNVNKTAQGTFITLQQLRRRRATIRLLTRGAVGIGLLLLTLVLHKFGHISDAVAFASVFVVDAWLSWLLGAWMQFMWGARWLR